MNPKVAIIGGGPTGIGIGRELNDGGIDFDIFESESDFGGVWNSAGECGRTYPSLHLISPKFNTQVQDFPMPGDYPDYPGHELMLRYIRSYARASGLYDKARFGARVDRLEPDGAGWRITTARYGNELYPLVVVCNGLQRVPRYPRPPYAGRFDGETTHSCHYKSPDQLRGKRVLVVGGGNSGCDIAVDAVHHSAAVYHSTRRGYYYQPKFIDGKPTPQWMMELGNKFPNKEETLAHILQVFRLAGFDGTAYGLPAPDYPLDAAHPVMNSQILYHIGHGDIVPKGDIAEFRGRQVRFTDGTAADFDLILYATGYDRDFPFLDRNLLEWKSGIPDLFLHSTPRNLDNLLFMGFINAAGGLGDGLKTQGLFVLSYARAFFSRTAGLEAFLKAKRLDNPDLGQEYFVKSHRHLWEADLWKLLAQMRKYRDLLDETPAPRLALKSIPKPEATLARPDRDLGIRLEDDVLRIAAEALGVPRERLDPSENLASYGIDSIAITEVMVRISRFFGISIAPTTFFEARNFHDLTTILNARYSKAVSAHYEPACAPPAAESSGDAARWVARHRKARIRRSAEPLAPVASSKPPAVAIIAMEGMFPQSPNLNALEEHLRRGDDCIQEVPPGRWDWRAVYGDPKKGAFTDVKYGGFIPGHDQFDAAFFGISPKEAELMDPQHRLFMECVWKLIENAGHAPSSLAGRNVGVFLGINLQDYTDLVNRVGLREAVQLTGLGHIFCPNRLSFLLDLRGPSQVIDTACSSSLVAVHRAVMSIRHEGCEMAIAGGANLMLTPTQHIMFSKVGMICADGRCKTFSKDANGYARADGVGAVLLKRLDLAERDGDPIIAVIRGSAENHGGAASSLTAPNPQAQARLILEAHRQAGIDPRSVSMIECHGTGTPLGDPVEVEGLKAAFAELYRERGLDPAAQPHCGLGSVKSNIGHAETAAGVAGLIKVLLAMRHGTLYRSLHCEDPNPLIDLAGSPFYLLNEARPWIRPSVDGVEAPRRAGVSSFGAGGANAHLIVEEYRGAATRGESAVTMARSYVVPLSAKNEPALCEAATRLLAHLKQSGAAAELGDIAFTLQAGRDAMPARMACVAGDMNELMRQLDAFASGDRTTVAHGVVGRGRRADAPLDPQALDVQSLAARWVAGAGIDWARAYADTQPRRVVLPAYPFARKRYWLPEPPRPAPFAMREVESGRFVVVLRGTEFFLADHRLNGTPLLPGVAYLELARAAAVRAGVENFRIRQAVWLKPLLVTAPIEIEIALIRDGGGWPRIEIARVGTDGARQLHFQARLAEHTTGLDGSTAPAITLAELGAMHPHRYSPEHVYRIFTGMGIDYGPSHRAILTLALGRDSSSRPQVLARLVLPDAVAATLPDFVLHPSLMDGAFQAALGMAMNEEGNAPGDAALPFALDDLEILGPCAAEMWVHIRQSSCAETSTQVRTLDLDLLDAAGVVRVRLRGFGTRISSSRLAPAAMMFEPTWLPVEAGVAVDPTRFAERLVLIAQLRPLPGCRMLTADGDSVAARYVSYAQQLLAELQRIASGPSRTVLLQVAVPDTPEGEMLAGLSGMLKTAHLEIPSLWCQLIAVAPGFTAVQMADALADCARTPQLARLRYTGSGAVAEGWRTAAEFAKGLPWHDGGVYLITGGAGAIGRHVARDMARNAGNVTIVLAGRSALDSQREDWRESLTTSGVTVVYQRVDVTDGEAVADLISGIRRRYGRLDGVVHAAGLLDDGLLATKSESGLARVLAPKVAGAVNLDDALGSEPLDFFVLFSSISGVLGNPGQADYAAANAFLDGFAASRELLRTKCVRHGRTVAIDWPVWREGGMRMNQASAALMRKTTGLTELETGDGVAALRCILASDAQRVFVAAGDRERVSRFLLTQPEPPRLDQRPAAAATAPGMDPGELERRILTALILSVCNQLKVSPDDLAPDIELSEYGFDSISFTQFANELNQRFDLEIQPMLFFEHPTLAALSAHLAKEHGALLARALGIAMPVPVEAPTFIPEPAPAVAVPARTIDNPAGSAVAIVGMSGVFPMARDLDAFWQNLVEGRDAIREVPEDRWDWRTYWGDPATEPGRTNVKWGGFIEGIGEFDPAFFGISAPEARMMDPQQRLLLTQAWRVIEDAGYAPRSLSGSNTGVFIGIADTGYGRLLADARAGVEGYSMTGLAPSMGPNRISFFLNLHGPSVAVETACSSSLVAIHRAVEAIRSGGVDAAIAGGVNTLLLPDSFVGFGKAGMLSPDGRSKPFSAAANGYARGEGVGLVFLKKLVDAERDGDRILAVIRATAENHGGRANSLTAPNPKAQADLLRAAYRRAGFDPRTVGYIEAHGTGTPLGDPIEVEALAAAFVELSAEAEAERGPLPAAACAVGSVKSNVGHLEIAAGVAGLIKVLLQLKHRSIVKTLHCDQLNPYLKLDGSPFHVARQNEAWRRPVDAEGRELPRRAGVSGFGFGGSNAHIVLEEYIPAVTHLVGDAVAAGPEMIVLSAATVDQLTESARRLRDFVANSEVRLADVAFTLQVGRDAMEHRLAFTASTMGDVLASLTAFAEGREKAGLYVGRVKPHRETMALLDGDEEVRRSLTTLPARGKHDSLLQMWVRGLNIDWRGLGVGRQSRRIALPGYPFATNHYWVTPPQAAPNHETILDGHEFFLRDHHVDGRAVLPGVVHLEMARSAIARHFNGSERVDLLRHTWLRPVVMNGAPIRLEVRLQKEADGTVAYQVISRSGDGESVHSGGTGTAAVAQESAVSPLDVLRLLEAAPHPVDVDACYRRFATLGMTYGPGHRALRELHTGDGLAVARLALPDGIGGDTFGLHPSLMDGALQAILSLTVEGQTEAAVPYSLRRLAVFGPTTPAMWAVVRPESNGGTSHNIDLLTEQGEVSARFEGFATRTLSRKPAAAPVELLPSKSGGTLPRTLETLFRIAASVLEVDAGVLEADVELGEYGFDSITMTGLATRVNQELGLSLTPADFFEFQTIDRLARHISELPGSPPAPTRVSIADAAPAAVPSPAVTASSSRDAIAIVGMSCRLPMAVDAQAFWRNLASGRDCIAEIPADRWDWRALHGDPKVESNKTNIRWAGFIDGVFEFDPLFFGISPREAKLMDPQQRLLLMHVWKALEDAGHAPRSFAGRAVGLFVGTSSSGYRALIGEDTGGEGYVATGSVPSVGPNRASFLLDWHGPSEPIETACSSSLVAVHRAVQSILSGDCEMAVAGGVNTIVTPEAHINFAKAGMLSPDGRCRTFSSRANGYVRGEGVAMLVLRKLSDAERDGDPIYGLIRGTAINHGGRANSLTAPNTVAQAEVLKTAYLRAGIDPRTVGYIEAHGTGTALGDPVEINALKAAFQELHAVANGNGPWCGIGSVKSNIGHLELAAGAAGIVKVLLQMRHRTLAASLHCEEQNPYIDLVGSPFFVVRENRPWPRLRDASGCELPRRAGVSSFGFGGVNAHVVIEEYEAAAAPATTRREPVIIALSARDGVRLREQAQQLVECIEAGALAGDDLADLSYTLLVGREAMRHRMAFVVTSLDDLRARLRAFVTGQAASHAHTPAGSLQQQAENWVSGDGIDTASLFSAKRRRLHLPTYPFAREQYRGGAPPASGDPGTVTLHPDAFYLRDHRINGSSVLPGSMTLELARAAWVKAAGIERSAPVSLTGVVWRQPVAVGVAPEQVRIAFSANGSEGARFHLLRGAGDRVLVQGTIGAGTNPDASAVADVLAIRARCRESMSAEQLYATYASLGLEYGPAFRAVSELFIGNGEALASLQLPDSAAVTAGDFVLHPSIVDAAFQSCLGLLRGGSGTALPFALERLDMLAPTTAHMWAHVRELPGGGAVRKLDIDLARDDGGVCVQIRGFSVRTSARHAEAKVAPSSAIDYFIRLIAAESGVAAADIAPDAPLESYGIDSIMITRLTDRLEQDFGPLPKTLFFEYQTLDALVGYFEDAHGSRLSAVTHTAAAVAVQPPITEAPSSRAPAPVDSSQPMAIAIIGVAGRYPGARTLGEFWENLAAGRDGVTEIPLSRWDHSRFYHPERGRPGKTNSKWGGFIEDYDRFDPLFFNISPREAEYIDPQERLFLEVAWETIEDAGYTRSTLAPAAPPVGGGNVGVFVGVMYAEYQLYGAERTASGDPLAVSSSPASIANRVSYFCNFHGPSMAVDSMCSSSLTAIHLACDSLAAGTCEVALAGGVNLTLHPNKYLGLAQGHFTSSTGHCESFGRGGDGYVPGEGAGAVLLKPLAQAIADGDQIYGVIRGSALNHGGKTNGYTVPNPHAQAAVIDRALARAHVDPRAVSYVEAHGTGTTLGDPIEIAALTRAFRLYTRDCGFCAIGSVKSNIGHCESAAGIAGLSKVLLQLKHRQLAPSLHAETLNPGIDFDRSPFVVQRRLEEWKGPRTAGLSSFGAGGSNAHLIIEEFTAPAPRPASPARRRIFPFSAHDGERLAELLRRFLTALEGYQDDDLPAIAHILQEGREPFEARVAVVAADRAELWAGVTRALRRDQPQEYSGQDDLDRLAAQWAQGGKVDWRARRGSDPAPRRISLPAYPFARERYWLPGNPTTSPAGTPAAEVKLPLLFAPRWVAKTVSASDQQRDRTVVVLCEVAPALAASVRTHLHAEFVVLEHAGGSIEVRFASYAEQLLQVLQRTIKERVGHTLLQVVVPSDGELALLSGLGGLLRSAEQENPSLRCQLVGFAEPVHDLASLLAVEHAADDSYVQYEGGRRLVREWRQLSAPVAPVPWKDGGVYLITGGAGGLGLLLAEEISQGARLPVIWLTSRSPLKADARARLDMVAATVVHRCVDVTHADEVAELVSAMRAAHGRIDGVIHAAGLTRDKWLVRKSVEELREVLAPKVAGLANLDAATAGLQLDFFVLFSSVSGAIGNPGQSDYAAANAFMDSFATLRNRKVERGERHGRTLSLDWPYWLDGGMRMDQGAQDAVRAGFGVSPLETAPAMAALRAGMAMGEDQILVLDGDRERLRRGMLPKLAERPAVIADPVPDPQLRNRVIDWVTGRLAGVLKMPAARLDPQEPLDRYGVDSVLSLEVLDGLSKDLGLALPQTLLFEHPKLSLLADALVESYGDALRTQFGVEPIIHAATGASTAAAPVAFNDVETGIHDIAVIAVAGRYPGADTIEAFWELLEDGRDCVTEVPSDRWDHNAIFSAEKGKLGASYCKWGGFLSGIDRFDAKFFGVSPRDAALMDPQDRLFLEVVWHLFERAGYTREMLRQRFDSRVGVFAGSMYQHYHAVEGSRDDEAIVALSSHASLANRVSFFFDLQGPSMALDTMCSSGLQAVHLARQSLERGECRVAIAGAVNLSIHPYKYLGLSRAALLGSSAGSRSFTDGDGYLPSEGVGAVLLKPLSDAIRDGDQVLAVIKGSMANHGGHSAGYSVPSAEAQARLIEENFRASRIDPRTISYVEAAANGSSLGDAIEFRALTGAFRASTADSGFCAIGSVKSNMGHAEAASGMAQLTKVLLQLTHKRLVPSLRSAPANPNINFAGTPFVLQDHRTEWSRMRIDGLEVPLRATVSSFGAGGSNVHLILEEGPGQEPAISSIEEPCPRQFIFSARSEEQLASWLQAMRDYVEQHPALSLSHLAYTLRARRETMACRFEVVARDRGELLEALLRERCDGTSLMPADNDGIDWSNVPPLVLPEYPFARERHWLTPPAPERLRGLAPALSGRARFMGLIARVLEEELGLSNGAIRPSVSFRDHGADSMFSLRLIHEVSDESGVRLSHSDLARYSTPEALADFLSGSANGHAPLTAPLVAAPPAESFAPQCLSEGQKGLWIEQKLHSGVSAYNVPLAFRVESVDRQALARACRFVLEQFPILSTVIEDADPEPRILGRAWGDPLQVLEVPPGTDSVAFARRRARLPFDLGAEPPIRFQLLVSDQPIVLVVIHHIVFDGLSAMHFTKTFWSAYQCFAQGTAPRTPPPAGLYADFVEWERQYLESPEGEADLAYWRRELAGDLPVLRIPADRAADMARAFEGDSLDRILTPDVSQRARECAARLGINASALFLGVFEILLYRYTGQQDILIAVPTAGRPARRFERTIGYFANMIPVRMALSGSAATAAFLKELQDKFTGALDHAAYPFAALARHLRHDAQLRPLHHVSYSYQNFMDEPAAGLAGVTHLADIRQEGDGALALEVFDSGQSVRIVAGFDARQFDQSTIRRLLDHFVQLLESVSARPDSTVAALDLLSPSERRRILTRWNHTAGPAPREGNVPEWIEEQAARTPDAVAVVSDEHRLTYRALVTRANRLAAHLRACGVQTGVPVAVCLGRSPQSIVALLAVLSCGGVWVPLDAESPDRRLSLILSDIGPGAIIVDSATQAKVSAVEQGTARLIRVDGGHRASGKRSATKSAVPIPSESPAYIIYTSGSTGRPKGVVVSHRAIAHHCLAAVERYGLSRQDVVLQFASHHVDVALEQILPALICGACLVLRGDGIWSPEEVRSVADTHRLTVVDLPPAYLRELLQAWVDQPEQAPSHEPRLLIAGGEALPPATVRLWQQSPWRQARLLNAYGPTETTITATAHEVAGDLPGEDVPIGRPLASGEVYILDRDGNPVPEGVPGELHIGGTRLATGYHGSDPLTATCFVPNPFSTDPGNDRLYRTGDVASFVPGTDGVIAFRGRLDHQVKIRGFRIELGEVESALRACGFRDAVAVVRPGITGEPALVVYVAPERSDVLDQQIVTLLSERLPAYMIPAAYIRMTALPVTSGGKLDRTSLPEIASTAPDAPIAPRDEIEEGLAVIWRQLLGRDTVGVFDDFFAAGGHSLLALRLLTLIRRKFGRDLTLASVIQAPTLAQQARLLRDRTNRGAGSPLILLREQGDGNPLFCVHPVGGGALCYTELARRLDIGRPIYGLQSPALDDGPYPDSVPAMASTYLAAIREIQPEGPYSLAGWSAGGVIAFEMARQLRGAGQTVQPLVLIDSYAPACLRALEVETAVAAAGDSHERWLRAFAADLLGGAADAARVPADIPPNRTVEQFLSSPAIDATLSGLSPARKRRFFDVFVAIGRAVSEYDPQRFDGPAVMFAATGSQFADPSRGWRALVGGTLTIHELSGDHYSIMQPGDQSGWIDVFADCLRRHAFPDPEPPQVAMATSGDR
jgi:amino acid adenylation domain-containing protein